MEKGRPGPFLFFKKSVRQARTATLAFVLLGQASV
jgi:hypothetical protein